MALFDRETDPEKERNGVRVVFRQWENVRLTLARGNANERLQLDLDEIARQFADRVGPVAEKEQTAATNLAFCRCVILRWETLLKTMRTPEVLDAAAVDVDGYVYGIDLRDKLVGDTPENMMKVFSAHGFEKFLDDVVAQSRNLDHFRLKRLENAAGN